MFELTTPSKSPRVLITGVSAIHGWPIYQKLAAVLPKEHLMATKPQKTKIPRKHPFISSCITDADVFESIRKDFRPTHVFHCAGVCDLDVCEERPKWARSINVTGPQTIAAVFGNSAHITFMSTDLVYSGAGTPKGGYAEEHPPDPISVAGITFAEGEKHILACPRHCVVRLGLPLGASINSGIGAIDWIESRFRRDLPVTLFHDEFRSCVRCEDIGALALFILSKNLQGLYHFGGERSWSLYEIGEHVLNRGPYPSHLLSGMLRREEKQGPPRIGDVSLNSQRIIQATQSYDWDWN